MYSFVPMGDIYNVHTGGIVWPCVSAIGATVQKLNAF